MPLRFGAALRRGEHLGREVAGDQLAAGLDQLRGQVPGVPDPGGQVEDRVPGLGRSRRPSRPRRASSPCRTCPPASPSLRPRVPSGPVLSSVMRERSRRRRPCRPRAPRRSAGRRARYLGASPPRSRLRSSVRLGLGARDRVSRAWRFLALRGASTFGLPLSREGRAGRARALRGVRAGWVALQLGITQCVEARRSTCRPDAAARLQAGFRLRRAATSTRATSWSSSGIPVTTVARILVDLTDEQDAHERRAHRDPRGRVPASSARSGRDVARDGPGERTRRIKVLEEALRMHASGSAGTRSRLEKRFRKLVRGAGFPQPRINTIVNGFEVDFATGPDCASRSTAPGTGARARRSTTGSRTPRCGRRLHRPALQRGRRRPRAREGPSAARGAAACPPALRGSESTGSIAFGTLKRARRAAANSRSSAGSSGARRTTWAVTASPHSGSGRPNTPASATAGWASRAASTSLRHHVLAARDDRVDLAAEDDQAPALVELGRGRRCAGAAGDRRAVDDDLAVVRDRHRHARERAAGGLVSPTAATVTAEQACVSP